MAALYLVLQYHTPQYSLLQAPAMNIVADLLNSKASTQAMLVCFLTDMKQYFKKAPLLSEQKTHARILKIADTTQKYLPQYYCVSNTATKLVRLLKSRVDDKLEDFKESENQKQPQATNVQKNQSGINEADTEAIESLQFKFSRENDARIVSNLTPNRDLNQEFMRKITIDTIDELKLEIEESEETAIKEFSQCLDGETQVLLFDSFMGNKAAVTKTANAKNIKIHTIKISGADPKLNEINLAEVSSKIRKFQKVIISAESVLKNGAIIAESGALMVSLAAKKYNVPVIALSRGFSLTEKVMIDQHSLVTENPMKYFQKDDNNALKVHIAKKFDLVSHDFIDQIVNQLGSVSPVNIQLHFSSYYEYN